MGMSAAQSRFLMLTAQKSNNEYHAQVITYERMALASNTQAASIEYNNKMNNRVLLFDGITSNGTTNYNARLKYTDIVNIEGESNDNCLGMRLVSSSGKIVVRSESEIKDDAKRADYLVDPDLYNSDALEANIRSGAYALEKSVLADDGTRSYESVMWSTIPKFNDVLSASDDAAAQSEYDRIMDAFHNQDKQLDMSLKKLETEHKALEVEADSVKKVVDKNVESSFKTFSA